MKVLGLVASYRKLGNTEVLVREALMETQRLGAETDLLRLTDLKIEPCKGCMACVFKQQECRIQDGWHVFRDKLVDSDGVILGVPTYFLGPAGIIKVIADRNIAIHYGAAQKTMKTGKPGAIISVAGIRGWEPFTVPMLNVFMFTCGLKVIDQEMFYAQGPGEILLDDSAVKRAKKLGSNVFEASGKTVEERTFVGSPGVCPACHQNLFSVKDGRLECALCQAKAELRTVNGKTKLVFDPETLRNNRWSEEALFDNFSSAILPSGDRFLREMGEIKKRTRRYEGEGKT